jgi:transposase
MSRELDDETERGEYERMRHTPTQKLRNLARVREAREALRGLPAPRAPPPAKDERVPMSKNPRLLVSLPPRIDSTTVTAGLVFVLRPASPGTTTSLVGCSGVTCWRRLRDWTEAGVWPALHELLLAQLRALDELDLDRCAVDGSHIRALKGGTTSARHRSTAAGPAPSTI